jgi:hypothetical protein
LLNAQSYYDDEMWMEYDFYVTCITHFISLISSNMILHLPFLSLLVAGLLLCLPSSCGAKRAVSMHEKFKDLCKGQPTLTGRHEGGLRWLVKNVGETNLLSSISPQHEAACWMFRQNKNRKGSFTPQRYALAVIYYGTKGATWDDNTSWMTSKHECSWFGVKCNMFRTVVELDLGYLKVDGLIPREIGLLKELTDLDLHGNDLQGVIPHKLMAGLTKLQYLRLQMNGFFGAIQKEIASMSNLREFYLYGNYMAGTIPTELAKLRKLEILDLYANQLVGTIPKELAKLPKLSKCCSQPQLIPPCAVVNDFLLIEIVAMNATSFSSTPPSRLDLDRVLGLARQQFGRNDAKGNM